MALTGIPKPRSGTSGLVRASVNNNNMEDVLKPPTIRPSHIFTVIPYFDRSRTSRRRRHLRYQLQNDDAYTPALRCRHRRFRPKSAPRPSPAVINT
ncbi:hypothetical protein IG631_18389 [Alternaria alternata]|nr:hypothetical protein IG631_18389 [Alternaria alternata]